MLIYVHKGVTDNWLLITYFFPMLSVWILGNGFWVIHTNTKFTQKVVCKLIRALNYQERITETVSLYHCKKCKAYCKVYSVDILVMDD